MPTRKFFDLVRSKSWGNLPKLLPKKVTPESYLDAESDLGKQLFGPIPENTQREFFHSTSKNVWLWHENGTTVRYEVRPHGVFKRIGSGSFKKLERGSELENFRLATHYYLSAVKSHLYKK